MEALREMAAPTATVLRDGEEIKVPARELVPGDMILLYAGDRVPADARLVEAVNLRLEEAPLTGESVPVEKQTAPTPGDELAVGDRTSMVYAGTAVTYGRGTRRRHGNRDEDRVRQGRPDAPGLWFRAARRFRRTSTRWASCWPAPRWPSWP